MLMRMGGLPLAGRCSTMIVSVRAPVMSCPSASWSSSVLDRPPRLSDPVSSQFVPAPAAGRPV